MKIQNLPFALLILFIAIVCLAIFGWGLSFLTGVNLAVTEPTEYTDIRLFIARVLIGLITIGWLVGLSKLWDLFVFVMTGAPIEEK